jgi:prephenate dehydrogenase
MKSFKKVAIVGVGLIGGSLAQAIRKRKLAKEIVGVSRHRRTLLLAKQNKVIDSGSLKLSIIKNADLVILAVPVGTILHLAPRIARLISKDCVVTDVGSTKEEIVSQLQNLFPNYLGSHPLAGSEKRGILSANPDIFRDSLCILTPTQKTNPKVLKRITKFWEKLGVKVVFLSPAVHDKIISLVSHLPHLVAFSLMGIIPLEYLKFSASGLKDTTRIAASEPELWADIFLSNKNTLKAIELFQANLSKIKKAIKDKDKKLILEVLKAAKNKRDALR